MKYHVHNQLIPDSKLPTKGAMKLVSRHTPKDAEEESISLLPEDAEDMWHAYNLIVPGDFVHGHAIRKVGVANEGTGATTQSRVHTNLTVRVTKIEFDPVTSHLRVSGPVVSENEVVSMGLHHTLAIEANRQFTITKAHGWDSVARDALSVALSDDKNGAMAAVVMQEGLANICLITEFRTVLKTKVEMPVPKKRDASKTQDTSFDKFFDKTLQSLLRAADFSDNSRPVLLASPGFVASDFKEYITRMGRDKSDKLLQALAKNASVIHTNTGNVYALNQVLQSQEVKATMARMNFTSEARYVDTFFEKLRMDDGRAWYGAKAVEKAIAEGAVGSGGGLLLINNSLFRSQNLDVRKKYVALVDRVKKDGGEVRVLSSEHESGERIKMMGDIAAVLNYPMFDLDEEEETEEEPAPPQRRFEEEDDGMLDSVI